MKSGNALKHVVVLFSFVDFITLKSSLTLAWLIANGNNNITKHVPSPSLHIDVLL